MGWSARRGSSAGGRPGDAGGRGLRLVRPAEAAPVSTEAPAVTVTPIGAADDPRWVLAVRTAEQLQGAVLPPERREKLIRLGKSMGLTAFDANLIVAIMQDQARRGRLPEHCPAAGEGQLAMVPLPRLTPWWEPWNTPRMRIALLVTAVVTLEILLLMWVF
jgi:hypothetical protein